MCDVGKRSFRAVRGWCAQLAHFATRTDAPRVDRHCSPAAQETSARAVRFAPALAANHVEDLIKCAAREIAAHLGPSAVSAHADRAAWRDSLAARATPAMRPAFAARETASAAAQSRSHAAPETLATPHSSALAPSVATADNLDKFVVQATCAPPHFGAAQAAAGNFQRPKLGSFRRKKVR